MMTPLSFFEVENLSRTPLGNSDQFRWHRPAAP